MSVRRLALVLILCASPAGAAELRTLKGETVAGDVVRITDKEIVIAKGGQEVSTPLAQVLQLDYSPGDAKLPAEFTDVELTDGSLLHCKAVAVKGKDVEMTLALGAKGDTVVKLPLTAVANLLREAHNEKYRRDWNDRVAKKQRRDQVAVRKEGVINVVSGTLGEADADGTAIEFKLGSGAARKVPLANVHGLIFQREIDPNAAPVVCKVTDASRNLLLASSVVSTPAGLTVTTPAGAKIEYPPAQLARLDYSGGKLTWLSDMDPVETNYELGEGRLCEYVRDRNVNKEPIRLDGVPYPRGLALLAPTELVFDLKGDYREFKAVAGIDDQVGGIAGPTVLRIEGDGKELKTLTFDRKDKDKSKAQEVKLNVKDVQKLRISVRAGDFIGYGKHLDLADAKVSK
jgi:hypothetical protein